MGTLPPTPNLGLVLPDPGTGQSFSTATQNGWFQAIDTAVGGLRGMANPATQLFRSSSTSDVSPTSTAHPFQLGPTGGSNLRIDNNEIMSVNNGVGDYLGINTEGGNIELGNEGSRVYIGGGGPDLSYIKPSGAAVGGGAGTATINPNGSFIVAGINSVRLNDAFPDPYSAYEVIILVTQMVAGAGVYPFLGMAASGTAATALNLHRASLAANGSNLVTTAQTGQSNCQIAGADPAVGGMSITIKVLGAALAAERTRFSFEAMMDTANGESYFGTIHNQTNQGDTDLRFGMSGGGTMDARGFVRHLGRYT